MAIDNMLQEILKESKEISQDVREHVVKSGICERCPNTSIYDKDRIEELIFLGGEMREILSDRSISDIESILKIYAESMEETNNDPYNALMILMEKAEKHNIDL